MYKPHRREWSRETLKASMHGCKKIIKSKQTMSENWHIKFTNNREVRISLDTDNILDIDCQTKLAW
jgi:hypothetical protein